MKSSSRSMRCWILLWLGLTIPAVSLGHAPHDVIKLLAVSPDFDNDSTLFIVVGDVLQRSRDGGRTWKRLYNGLDHRSPLSALVVSPRFAGDDTVFAATRADGIYRSTDRGNSWHRLGSPASIQSLAVAATAAAELRMLAVSTTGTLQLSEDDGVSWVVLDDFGDSIQHAAIEVRDGVTRVAGVTGDGLMMIGTPGRVETGVRPEATSATGRVRFGVDGDVFAFGGADSRIWRMAIGEDTPRALTPLPDGDGRPAGRVTSLTTVGHDGRPGPWVATAWDGGAYLSSDSGRTWTRISIGLTRDAQAGVHNQPQFRYVSAASATWFLAGFDGLFRSDDSGRQWRELETLKSRLPTALAVGDRRDGRHDIVLSTFDGGVYHSRDEGQRWTTLNRGLQRPHLWSIELGPDTNDGRLLFAASNRAVYRIQGFKEPWERRALGCKARLESRSSLEIYWDKAQAWLGHSEACKNTFPHALTLAADFPISGRMYFGTRYEGIFRSDDRGHSWQPVWDAEGGWIDDMAAANTSASGSVLFASVVRKGLYHSTDAGETWRLLGSPALRRAIAEHKASALPVAVAPQSDGALVVFAGTPKGLFRSSDGGRSWTESAGALRNAQIMALAVSPRFATDGRMLVSARGLGLFESSDGGVTFAPVAEHLARENHMLKQIEFSPDFSADARIYAISDEELLISADSGSNWSVVPRPIRYEVNSDSILLDGPWETLDGPAHSANIAVASSQAGATLELRFSGSGISVLAPRSPELGIIRFTIDDDIEGFIDQYAPKASEVAVSTALPTVEPGNHRVKLVVSGDRHPDSRGNRVVIDALEVDDAQ